MTDHWYPRQKADRLWYPADAGAGSRTLPMGFELRSDCVAYLERTRLIRGNLSPVDLAKGIPSQPTILEDGTVIEPLPTSYRPPLTPADPPPDDDRSEWVDIRTISDTGPVWIKGRCNHRTPAPVDLRTGELVAWWCPDCGEQFPAGRWTCPPDLWLPLPDIIRPPWPGQSFVDAYADPGLIGPAYPKIGFVDVWDSFVSVWDAIKQPAVLFLCAFPLWLPIVLFVIGWLK